MTRISQYQIYYFGGGSGQEDASRAGIRLIGERGESVGWLKFWRNASDMPASDDVLANGVIRGHLPQSQLGNVLDLLRNERPLFLRFGEFGLQRVVISSNGEAVGEAERRLLQ